MLSPNEASYRRAKAVKRGWTRLDPRLDDFLRAFELKFGFAPLWIGQDRIFVGGRRIPRLEVCCERTAQADSFHVRGKRSSSFDSRKQKRVAAMFLELVPSSARTRLGPAENLFVYFSSFEDVALREVHAKVTPFQLRRFARRLALGRALWRADRYDREPVIFTHTEAQAEACRAEGLPARWSDAYFAIAKRHDTFGILERSTIHVRVDSKENLDENYEGRLFYYWK